jgi:CHAD domain-containing protein
MPKPVMPDNLTTALPAGKAACALLDAKIDEVASFAHAAMSGDVDGLHDMRVAVKRLREVLRVFRRLYSKKRLSRVLPAVEELNNALGRVRDLDVMATNVGWVAEQAPEVSGLVEILQGIWAEQRSQAHSELVQLWDRLLGHDHIVQRLRRLARSAKARKSRLNRLPCEKYGYMAIAARAQRVRQRIAENGVGEDPARLHLVRLAVKRLKYTTEPFQTILPSLDGPYKPVAKAQEAVGLARDFDVLATEMGDYFERRGLGQTHSAQRAMAAVSDRRDALHVAARLALERLASDDWHRQLLDAID